MRISFEITGSARELAQFVRELRGIPGVVRNDLPDPLMNQRYHAIGRISDCGSQECIDTRTGQFGVMHAWAGFLPGVRVTEDGYLSDNPLQGWRP